MHMSFSKFSVPVEVVVDGDDADYLYVVKDQLLLTKAHGSKVPDADRAIPTSRNLAEIDSKHTTLPAYREHEYSLFSMGLTLRPKTQPEWPVRVL
jgi:hypothetical protein